MPVYGAPRFHVGLVYEIDISFVFLFLRWITLRLFVDFCFIIGCLNHLCGLVILFVLYFYIYGISSVIFLLHLSEELPSLMVSEYFLCFLEDWKHDGIYIFNFVLFFVSFFYVFHDVIRYCYEKYLNVLFFDNLVNLNKRLHIRVDFDVRKDVLVLWMVAWIEISSR